MGRHTESHLTEQGQEQVRDAAKQLKTVSIDKVYASPVTRAVETAKIVCEELGVSYEVDERLYEIEL